VTKVETDLLKVLSCY